MIKLPLRPSKPYPAGYGGINFPWASCAPFVENSRGVLIHRPRAVSTITLLRAPHLAIGYWCGNGVAGKKSLTFLAAPPENAILCEICERNAVAAGLPTADSLAGRHVHKGRLKTIKTCGCAQEESGS